MVSADQEQTSARSRAARAPARHAGPGAEATVFRSPLAVLIWWVWLVFALANLIDLAVQGRDHFSVVAAFILVLVTGVVYTTAQRPRIIADDDGLTIVNPLRQHRIGWAAVTAVEATDLVRVRCEWPAPPVGADQPAGHNRVIYSWAVGSSRRRMATAQMRTTRARPRPPRGAAAAGEQVVDDVGPVVSALGAYAERARAVAPRRPALPPVSTWYWPAVAAIVIPALALVIAVLA
jgi:hypothetical protein